MVLYLIGLGLGDETDITLRGLNAIRSCSHVFLEEYTSILTGVSKERLQSAYGCVEVVTADREMVESGAEAILDPALHSDVAFLVVGDPFASAASRLLTSPFQCLPSTLALSDPRASSSRSHLSPPPLLTVCCVCRATTHHDLFLRASAAGIRVEVVHNASIHNAVASTGLQLYHFGQTVSVPFFRDEWRPDSFYDRLRVNAAAGLHSLVLLDIKVKEQSVENMAKYAAQPLPPLLATSLAGTGLLTVAAGASLCGAGASRNTSRLVI